MRRATTRESRALNVGVGERELAAMLRAQGLGVTPQRAVGPYNVDLAAGTVAVEVLGGGWHARKRHGERLRYLLDRGFDVVYAWVDPRRDPLGAGAAQHVIACAQRAERHPRRLRRYWVIRGSGELVAEGRSDDDELPDKLPSSRRARRSTR